MLKTDILFTGYYGNKNTGDDAFVEVASWGAKHYWRKSNNRFLAIKQSLPETTEPARGYPLTLPKTYGFQSDLLIRNTDYLISAGGSTIHSEMLSSNFKMKALEQKRRKGKIKIGGIGVSVGPFKSKNDEIAIKKYLKDIDFISVRDNASYEFVSSLNLPYEPINSFDLAALLPLIYDHPSSLKKLDRMKTIGVSVCPYESVHKHLDNNVEIKRNQDTNELLKALDRQANVHFKFFIFNGHNDVGDKYLTLKTIEKVLPRSFEIVDYNSHTKSTWQGIASCDFVISTRLHAAIFACFANIPFMLNEYHRKCTDFLENVGYNESQRLYNSEYNISDKANQILRILNDLHDYKYPGKVSEMAELAKFNFTKIPITCSQ